MAFDSVSQAQNLWIKGKSFTIENLLGERYGKEAKDFDGCSVGIFRVSSTSLSAISAGLLGSTLIRSSCSASILLQLAPQDYHRFHCPVDGRVGDIELIEGAYYTV
jgi:phosphatidylserine decarboxylase